MRSEDEIKKRVKYQKYLIDVHGDKNGENVLSMRIGWFKALEWVLGEEGVRP